jgi:DNA-binding transcriptional ArsR family regulator
MTHVSPNEVATFRSLKNTSTLLLLMFRLDRPAGETELAEILDQSPKTVRGHLRSLKYLGVVTRTNRYSGWQLTQGGRQLVLGEVQDLQLTKTNGNFYRSPSPAAASLSLIKLKASNGKQQQLSEGAAEEEPEKSKPAVNFTVQNENPIKTNGKFYRSRVKRKCPLRKRKTADSAPRFGPDMVQGLDMVCRNLDAFQSVGLGLSRVVRNVAELDHVHPDYILSQARRLEGEGRYSPGLLIKVVRDGDPVPPRYRVRQEQDPEPEPVPEPCDPGPQPDPSVNAPAGPHGLTASRAWETALQQLQRDLPKESFNTWVKRAHLIAFLEGAFVVHAGNAYTRDWLESRLTSTLTRLLTGICNRSIEVRFTDIIDL